MNHPCEDCRQSCDVPCWKVDHGLLVEPPRWIPVTDRLPDREEDVLMMFETGIITGGFICDSDTWCAYADGEYYTDCTSNPTHWMPLPEPPKEDNH